MNENIKAFITTMSGLTLIAYVKSETPEYYELENALMLVPEQSKSGSISVGFGPLSIYMTVNGNDFSKGVYFNLQKSLVFLSHPVNEMLAKNYTQTVGRIAVVPASALFTGK